MISFMEVNDDLLQLDRYGIVPNTNVNFYFDSGDFACALAWKLGQLKEYKVKETTFQFEMPDCVSDVVSVDVGGKVVEHRLSDDYFPYTLGYNTPLTFESEILTGRFSTVISSYELDREYVVPCLAFEHDDLKLELPTNEYTVNSFKRKYASKDYVETMLFLKYSVQKVQIRKDRYKNILRGKLFGGVLFRDLNKIGKYMDQIHPEVGDIVTIGFPSDGSRQRYEITECNDKIISNDGINPLLHKYVWKCRAKRYVNSGEDFPEKSEADERVSEGLGLVGDGTERVAKEIASYDERENDAVYGGYERKTGNYDSRRVDVQKDRLTFLDDGQYLQVFVFGDGCRLMTDGYELFYADKEGNGCRLTTVEDDKVINENLVASGIQYLKATDNALYFVNFDNKCCRLCEDESITGGEIELCLNSLVETTLDGKNNNQNGQFFYKFRESNTVLMSLQNNLYCRLGNKNGKVIKLT